MRSIQNCVAFDRWIIKLHFLLSFLLIDIPQIYANPNAQNPNPPTSTPTPTPKTYRWFAVPAFSGQEINGEIWGRGALDMKGMGAIELMTFIAISRLKLTLKRSLTLIAVADEEVDNLGMKQLLDQYWDQLDCAYLINEGGIGYLKIRTYFQFL